MWNLLLQIGCPFNYDTLKEAIMSIRKSAKSDKKVPVSIVVIPDRDWLIGGMDDMPVITILFPYGLAGVSFSP
jgi:hypothetical protein